MFNVALYGLDNIPAEKIKSELIAHGYKCTEVKTVTKKYDRFTDNIYIVCFENGTVRIHDLRTNCKNWFYTNVKWDHQKRLVYPFFQGK